MGIFLDSQRRFMNIPQGRGRHSARWWLPRVDYFLEILISEKESKTSQTHTVIWVVTFCIDYSESIAGWGQSCSRGGLKEAPGKEHCVYLQDWVRMSVLNNGDWGGEVFVPLPCGDMSICLPGPVSSPPESRSVLEDSWRDADISDRCAGSTVNTSQEILCLSTWSLVSLSPSGHMEYSMTQTPQCQTNSSVSVVNSTDCSTCAPQWCFRVCHIKIPQTRNMQSCLLESLRRWISDSDSIYTCLPIFVTSSTVFYDP